MEVTRSPVQSDNMDSLTAGYNVCVGPHLLLKEEEEEEEEGRGLRGGLMWNCLLRVLRKWWVLSRRG